MPAARRRCGRRPTPIPMPIQRAGASIESTGGGSAALASSHSCPESYICVLDNQIERQRERNEVVRTYVSVGLGQVSLIVGAPWTSERERRNDGIDDNRDYRPESPSVVASCHWKHLLNQFLPFLPLLPFFSRYHLSPTPRRSRREGGREGGTLTEESVIS